MSHPDAYYLPELVNIELTNHCNIRCIICPHGHGLVKNKGYMSIDVFKRIIDGLAAIKELNLQRINLCGVGESLLHPQFFEMAEYGKNAGFKQTLTTNAFFLTPENADKLFEINALDYIELSFEDTPDKFEKFKGGKIWDIVVENIKYFVDHNKNIKARLKFIQYTMDKQKFEIPLDVKKKFESTKLVFVANELANWRGKLDLSFLNEEVRKQVLAKASSEPTGVKCNNGANMGMFSWDGSVRSCYLDYNNEHVFGNVMDQPVKDILLCEDRRKFIDNIVNKLHTKNLICQDCLAPYNALSRKVLLETQNEKVETTGTQFTAMEKLLK